MYSFNCFPICDNMPGLFQLSAVCGAPSLPSLAWSADNLLIGEAILSHIGKEFHSMLAERRKREKWSLNPCGNFWSKDASKFGQQMLEKMGWKPGCGLGAKEQGITEQIKVAYKNDKTCIGFKEHGQEWLEQQSQFENLLAELGNSHDAAVSAKRNESLEVRSRQSRARVHYQKFTRGKDLTNYSDKDLVCILGVKKSSDITGNSCIKESKNDTDTSIGKLDNLYGVTTVNGGNMSDYFIKKKHKSLNTAPEGSHAEIQKEQVESDCRAEIVTKKQQKHKNTARSDSRGKEVGQETKEHELTLNDDSADSLKCKRKTRKMDEGALEGEYLLKKGERGDDKTDCEQYCEKNVYHLEEKGNSFMQECTTKRKRKENQDMAGKEVSQETGGNETNDSANCFNYKGKKRKMEQVAKEHLLKEEEITKQDRRISVKESCSEKNMNTSEVENKVKRKKKRKEKDTEYTDAHGKEVEADRNEITLLNGDSRSGLNCKKKKMKLKEELEVKVEDEITEQGKKVSEFDSFVPEMYYPSKNKRERNSFQGNDQSVDYQDAEVTVDYLVNKKDSSRKLKHCRKYVDRDTEVDHSEKKDHEIVEEEIRKHKSKKMKKRKHSKDENTPEIQEHELVQYNLEETEAVSCDRKNSEELSVTSENSVFVTCRNNVGKETKRKDKVLNNSCVSVELECEKDERIQEQEDTETNEQKSKTAMQNDRTVNIEDSKETRNNSKQKQDFCNSSAQNIAGAIIEVNDFKKIDISRRNMRPSVFAQLVHPSLIRFRGSNLHKISGYGNC